MQILGDKDRSQIDLYDTFGYLVPGAMLLFFAILTVSAWHDLSLSSVYNFIENVSATVYITSIITFLFVSYVFGHVIASIAEIIYDRIFVGKIFQYPYVNLFFEKNENKSKANFYRSLVTLIYLESVLISLLPYTKSQVIPYVISWLPSATFIFLILRWLQTAGSRNKRFIKGGLVEDTLRSTSHVFDIFSYLISRPFSLVENFLNKLMGFDQKFPVKLTEKFKDKFECDFGKLDQDEFRSEIYWLPYWKVTEESEHMRDRLNKFLSLHGMMRNSSVSLYLSALLLTLPGYFYDINYHLPFIGTGLLVLSLILSVRYYYIYFHYYSKSVFRTYIIMKND